MQRGSLLALPFADGRFDRALCLDVLEHLAYEDQPKALAELHRVLGPGGELLVSVPNLAHLQSRVHFLLTGRLIRTASEVKHPGDRPLAEYRRLFDRAGFAVVAEHGVFPTVPVLTVVDPPQAGRSRLAAPRADPPAARGRRCRSWPSSRCATSRNQPATRQRGSLERGPILRCVLDRLSGRSARTSPIYGLGDVATSIVSFLLLPLYARFLTPEDYGAIGLLLAVEVVAQDRLPLRARRLVHAALLRLRDERARQRLASTIFWFLAVVNGGVLLIALVGLPLSRRRHAACTATTLALRILLLNTFIIGFYFIPFHVLRMTDQPAHVRGADDQPVGGHAADRASR